MSFVIEDVLVRSDPVGKSLPVLFDSPHSGRNYPADFRFSCPLRLLRQAEDTYVDELFAAAPDCGATLIHALFPRSYIDANRAIDDIDPTLIDGVWPEPLHPSDKSVMGIGLIRSICQPGMPLYDGRLPVAEVADRINRFYRPYHFQMAAVLNGLAGRFGSVWHMNCHSMPSASVTNSSRRPLADFVIGDQHGSTADPAFVAFVAETLRGHGYSVAFNDPFKGVELVSRYADPTRGRHSIQLEVNRRLYLNEDTQEKTAGFPILQEHLVDLIEAVCAFARGHIGRLAAE